MGGEYDILGRVSAINPLAPPDKTRSSSLQSDTFTSPPLDDPGSPLVGAGLDPTEVSSPDDLAFGAVYARHRRSLEAMIPDAERAIQRGLDLAESGDSRDVAVALHAADRVTDRLFGRPTERVEVADDRRLTFIRIPGGVSTRPDGVLTLPDAERQESA